MSYTIQHRNFNRNTIKFIGEFDTEAEAQKMLSDFIFSDFDKYDSYELREQISVKVGDEVMNYSDLIERSDMIEVLESGDFELFFDGTRYDYDSNIYEVVELSKTYQAFIDDSLVYECEDTYDHEQDCYDAINRRLRTLPSSIYPKQIRVEIDGEIIYSGEAEFDFDKDSWIVVD